VKQIAPSVPKASAIPSDAYENSKREHISMLSNRAPATAYFERFDRC
jgi:hypothetical protein